MSSTVGYPKELMNEISNSIDPNMKAYQVKVVPSNVSQVQSPTQTITGATTFNQLNNVSQNLIFDIPANQGKHTFIDHRCSNLNFRVAYEVVTTTSGIIANMQLRSSALSFFNRNFMTSASGAVIDDVNFADVINDLLIQGDIGVHERDQLALLYGFQYEKAVDNQLYATNGHKIAGIDASTPAAATIKYYSYCVPLLNSLFGVGADKFFQIGACQKLTLNIATAPILPLTIYNTSGSMTFRVTIDNISLNLNYLNIGEPAVKLLNKTGLQYFSGITYRASSGTIPAGTSGNIQVLTGLRGSSTRALWFKCTEAATQTLAACANYIQDSKCPLATSISWNINGELYPSNPVNGVNNPSKLFYDTMNAFGNFTNREFKSGVVPSQYFIYPGIKSGSSLPTDADQVYTSSGTASTIANVAQFSYGYNLETISKFGILDGKNISSGQTFLNINLAVPFTETLTLFFINKLDIIYVLNTDTGDISVRM